MFKFKECIYIGFPVIMFLQRTKVKSTRNINFCTQKKTFLYRAYVVLLCQEELLLWKFEDT